MMPDQHVSEKAVELAWAEVWGSEPQPEDFLPEFRAKDRIRETLEAALPAIYEQRDREWRERLLSEASIFATVKSANPLWINYKDEVKARLFNEAKATIQAALAAAFPAETE